MHFFLFSKGTRGFRSTKGERVSGLFSWFQSLKRKSVISRALKQLHLPSRLTETFASAARCEEAGGRTLTPFHIRETANLMYCEASLASDRIGTVSDCHRVCFLGPAAWALSCQMAAMLFMTVYLRWMTFNYRCKPWNCCWWLGIETMFKECLFWRGSEGCQESREKGYVHFPQIRASKQTVHGRVSAKNLKKKHSQHQECACFTLQCIYYLLLQGSMLQIQGPRGYKGSKGDLVRALKLFLRWPFSNKCLPGENHASRAKLSDQRINPGTLSSDVYIITLG